MGWSRLVTIPRAVMPRLLTDQFQQITDFAVRFNGVAQRFFGEYLVVVLAADFLAADKSFVFQFLHNPLHGAFRNAHAARDFSQDQPRIGIQHGQHMGVVGEEGPAMSRGCGGSVGGGWGIRGRSGVGARRGSDGGRTAFCRTAMFFVFGGRRFTHADPPGDLLERGARARNAAVIPLESSRLMLNCHS